MAALCSGAPILTARDVHHCGRALFEAGFKARTTLSRVEFARLLWAAYNRHMLRLCGPAPIASRVAAFNDWWISLAGRSALSVWVDLLTDLARFEDGRHRDWTLAVAQQVGEADVLMWQVG